MFDLGKKLEELWADINPFDGGATGATVRSNRNKPAPAQTLRVQTARPQSRLQMGSVQQPKRPLTIEQPKPLPLPKIERPTMRQKPKQQPRTPLDHFGKFLGEAGENVGNFGAGMVSGLQQSAGNVADVATMGGAVITDVADQLNPTLTDAQRRQRLIQNYENTERLRSGIKGMKTVTGESFNPIPDYKPTGDFVRDAANLAGRGLRTGLDATAFINPTRMLVNPYRMSGREALKYTARDAGFFGAGEGLAAGAQTYGQTGDLGKAVQAGATSALLSAGTQGALGLGGYAAGKVVRPVGRAYMNATDAYVNRPTPNVPQSRLLTEGGFAKVPGGKSRPDLTPEEEAAALLRGEMAPIKRAIDARKPNITEQEYNELINEAFRRTEAKRLAEGQEQARLAFEQMEADPKVQAARVKQQREKQAQEAIERGFANGPRHTIQEIIDTVAELGYVPSKKVVQMVKEYAKRENYDISTGRAFKRQSPNTVNPLHDAQGNMRAVDELRAETVNSYKNRIKKPGVEHAIPYGQYEADAPYRQMVYKNDDGTLGTYYQHRTPSGKWERGGKDAPAVKSQFSKKFISEVQEDATINAEAKRAYDEGTTSQYIWKQNDKGEAAEFMREFDEALGDVTPGARVDSNKIVHYDPDKHYIESGRVVESKTGKILGNYIEITPDGVNMFAGRKKIHLGFDDLDFNDIRQMKFGSGTTWSTEGVIDRVTGNRKRTNTTDYFKGGGHKTKEALNYVMVERPREALRALEQERQALGTAMDKWENEFKKLVPKSKQKDALQDAVYVIEPAKTKDGSKVPPIENRLANYEQKYGKEAAQSLAEYEKFVRATYDNLLIRLNDVRRAQGKTDIPRRKDYITHIGEMFQGGLLKQTLNDVRNIMSGDVVGDTRGALPAALAGKSKDFKPTSIFNKYEKQRTGDIKPENPFDPLRVYADVALQNIHMTDPIMMNRALETAIRALSEARTELSSPRGLQSVAERLDDVVDKARGGKATADEFTTLSKKLFGLTRVFRNVEGVDALQRTLRRAAKAPDELTAADIEVLTNAGARVSEQIGKLADDVELLNGMKKQADGLNQFVTYVQEHTNKMAGKTHPLTRYFKDMEASPVTNVALKAVKLGQQQAALSKIVGNLSSAINQIPAAASTLGTTNPKYQMQGLKLMNNKKLMAKSDAMWLRYNESNLKKKSNFQKTMDVGGLPLKTIEKGTAQWIFATQYAVARGKGLDDRQAVKFAERYIGDFIGWRDSASAPKVYDSLGGALLQFTREITQQNRGWWNRLNKKEKVGALLAMSVITNVLGSVTGNKVGPDVIGYGLDVGSEVLGLNDGERDKEDNTLLSKTGRIAQRTAGEVASSVPLLSSGVNALPKDLRKKVFGTDSDFGRFDGNIAALGGLVNTGYALASSNPVDAFQKAAGELPFGSQIKKTWQGGEALMQGYTENESGKVQTPVSRDPFNIAKGLLFGRNALDQQRAYYDADASPLGENQSVAYKTLLKSDPTAAQDFFNTVQAGRKHGIPSAPYAVQPWGKSDSKPSTKSASRTEAVAKLAADKEARGAKFKASFSEEDYKILNMSKADRKKLVDSGAITQKQLDGLDAYANAKRKELGYPSKSSQKKSYADQYKAAKADWDANSKNWSVIEKAKKKEDLGYLRVQKDFDKDTVSLYGMSKGDVYNLVSKDKNGKAMVQKILKYGDALVKAGVTSKNKYRDKYGNLLLTAPGTRSGGGRRGRKGSSVFDFKLFGPSAAGASNSKQLYDMLKQAKVKRRKKPKSPTPRVA